ncbi:MAG: TetR/AcrR family transcriptional regulator [Desulfatiglandaceae bacterium]
MKNRQTRSTKKGISNNERSQQTFAQLIAVARKLFSAHGYSHTSLEEIVRKAGMTRGALYHHFEGKKGIFVAVFENALSEIANRVIQVDKSKRSFWEKFISCTYAFYEACLDSDLQRIVLIDGPAVLGWDVWRRIDEAKTLNILRTHLKELLDRGIIKPLPLEPLTHLISGAVNESVLWIGGSEDPKKAFDEAWSTMNAFLGSLRN